MVVAVREGRAEVGGEAAFALREVEAVAGARRAAGGLLSYGDEPWVERGVEAQQPWEEG